MLNVLSFIEMFYDIDPVPSPWLVVSVDISEFIVEPPLLSLRETLGGLQVDVLLRFLHLDGFLEGKKWSTIGIAICIEGFTKRK